MVVFVQLEPSPLFAYQAIDRSFKLKAVISKSPSLSRSAGIRAIEDGTLVAISPAVQEDPSPLFAYQVVLKSKIVDETTSTSPSLSKSAAESD